MSRVLVTGAAGQVGREVVELLGASAIPFDHSSLDVANREQVLAVVSRERPDAIVHCAAFTAVDKCESERDAAFTVNQMGNRYVQQAAFDIGAYLVTISTDYVFDGLKEGPYVETDATNPQSAYGQSKLAGEIEVDVSTSAVVRASWIVGRYGANMVKTILRLAGEHETLTFVDDQVGHPTIAADLASMLVRFVDQRLTGIWHVTNQGAVSWYEFAQEVLRATNQDPERVKPITTAELDPPRPAPRPANSVLANAKLVQAGIPLLPDFRPSLLELVGRL
ncbi:MAG TPA: dTDP-4-dehydrorhamnose reductase [Acidimicrobiia bacterium]|nr:dTDP-4-dehydrorhamnose reductase [Acidimicrobiia bacterium]